MFGDFAAKCVLEGSQGEYAKEKEEIYNFVEKL